MDERAFDDLLECYRWRYRIEDPSILDWTGAMRVRTRITDAPVRDERPNAPARNTVIFGPASDRVSHPDRSVQMVVLDARPSATRLSEARRVARDAIVIRGRDGSASAEWLRAPGGTRTEVSVVVRAGEVRGRLEACLRSLHETTPVCAAIELLVADGGESDDVAGVARAWTQRLGLRRVQAAGGPIAACNRAAGEARGELLVFVGDDTLAAEGWLRPLVRTLREDPTVGVAGAKRVCADGTLADAGGVLFADGSLASFGEGMPDAEAPVAGFVRDVDHVAADLLATRSGLFRRLGGFDGLFAAYEAADYCLRVRAAGRRVVYQPQSVVVGPRRPAPGASGDGRARFVRRWATSLAAMPASPEHFDAATWARLARSASSR